MIRDDLMKNIHHKTIGCALGLLLSAHLPGCGRYTKASGFVGEWTNKNFETQSVTRVHIRLDGDKIVAHEWGRCSPQECDWGDATATAKGSGLSVTWKTGFSIVTQELALLDDGSLQVSTHTHFTDNSGRKDYDSKETFAKGLVHDWSDPAPK